MPKCYHSEATWNKWKPDYKYFAYVPLLPSCHYHHHLQEQSLLGIGEYDSGSSGTENIFAFYLKQLKRNFSPE